MRATSLLKKLLGIKKTSVTGFVFGEDGLIVDVLPTTQVPVCSGCLRHAPKVHDTRERLWRHLDFGTMKVRLRSSLRRLKCPRCGVTTELVPWAQPQSWFTDAFEHTVAHLAQSAAKTFVADTMRVAWSTVGSIVARFVDRHRGEDPLAGLTHIGIDELSYRRHHEYVTVVVDHVKPRIVWAAPGKNADTLRSFFAELGAERCAKLDTISIDMSGAYIAAVTECAPNARMVFDRFHVQRLAHDALDKVRREQVRAVEDPADRRALKNTRFALQKNPWNLDAIETGKLADVQRTNEPLYRAYLLKESLAAILDRRQPKVASRLLEDWESWAAHSKLAPFAKLARTIRKYHDGIIAYVATGMSNGRTEGLNGKARTITRRSYGLHSATSLIGMLFLCCSGLHLKPAHSTPSFH